MVKINNWSLTKKRICVDNIWKDMSSEVTEFLAGGNMRKGEDATIEEENKIVTHVKSNEAENWIKDKAKELDAMKYPTPALKIEIDKHIAIHKYIKEQVEKTFGATIKEMPELIQCINTEYISFIKKMER